MDAEVEASRAGVRCTIPEPGDLGEEEEIDLICLAQSDRARDGRSVDLQAWRDGGFDFVTGEALVSSQSPPFGGLVQAAEPGTQGGTFYTECCLPPSTVFPAQLDFGSVAVNTTSSSQKITITNVQPSSGNLNIASISITGTNAGDFSQTNNCGSSLAPLASCTVTVSFEPTQAGARTANLTVTDSGGSA